MDDGHDPAADPLWYPDDYPREAAAATDDDFVDMFDDYYSTDDLFELVWKGGGEGGGRGQPEVSCLRSSPPPPLPPERAPPDKPPSEDVMAAWLYPIVSGEEHVGDGDVAGQRMADGPTVPAAKEPSKPSSTATRSLGTMTTESKGKLPTREGMSGAKDTNTTSDSSERRKTAGGSSRTRSSHHSGTHNITEKRRRCKITDRLRTLRQLVPGCDKSNRASTLDQTIQYMKSLQQHVQSMSVGCGMRPATAATPVCPVVAPQLYMQPPPPPAVAMPAAVVGGGCARPAAGMVPMVPYGAVLQYLYYHAVMMRAAAAAATPLYRQAPAARSASPNAARAASASPNAARAAAAGCDHVQCSFTMEEQQHKKEKERRRS